MEPHNPKYADDYAKLKAKMENNNRQYNNGYYGTVNGQPETTTQMGGTDSNGCVDWCLTMCCMNMLCNSCCR